MDNCPTCGDQKEDQGKPVCYGCHLAGMLPPGYQRKEQYGLETGYRRSGQPILSARQRPKTGVELLDAKGPVRVLEITGGPAALDGSPASQRLQAELQHRAEMEARQGLDDDF